MHQNKVNVTKQPMSRTLKSKKWLILLAVLVLVGITASALEATNQIDLFKTGKPATKEISDDGINYRPPTKEEQQAADNQKEAIVKQQTGQNPGSTPANPTAKKSVKPIITSAGLGDVRGYVPGITENGGTCTARFTYNGQTVTKTSAGFADAQNTVCPPISYDSGVGPGWKVTLTYQSSVSEGTSDASEIQ